MHKKLSQYNIQLSLRRKRHLSMVILQCKTIWMI